MVDQIAPLEGEKYATRYPQAEVNYTPDYQGSEGRCASCRWFIAHSEYGEGCTIVDSYPADILPTGRCDRHEAMPEPEPYVQQVEIVSGSAEAKKKDDEQSDVGTVEVPKGVRRLLMTIEKSTNASSATLPIPQVDKQTSLAALVKSTVVDMLHRRIEPQVSGFKTFGNHWVGWWTNNAEDRDKEWFPAKAIDDYVDRVDVGVIPQPTLWFWHIPGSRHGVAEWQGRIEHYCVAVGSFDDTPAGKAARDHYNRSKARYGMSHGFAYDTSHYQDGAYHQFNTFELSVLPPQVAANPYTDFEGIKQMALSPEKVQALEKLVGKDLAAQIISETEAKSKALDELNVQFKDYVEVNPSVPSVKASDECVKKYTDEGMSEDDAKAKCMEEKEARSQKQLADLFVDILKDHAGVVTIVDAMGKAIKAQGEATTALVEGFKQDLTALKEQLDNRPRSATRDGETLLNPDNQKEAKIKAEADKQATTISSFWGTDIKEN